MSDAKFTGDAYSQAVEYLTENPGDINSAWTFPHSARGGCLFRMASPSGECVSLDRGSRNVWGVCGCLTQIRQGGYYAYTESLELLIKSDNRIPRLEGDITVDHLPLFASWQRHIDRVLGRTVPALDARLPAPKNYVRDLPLPGISAEVPMTRGMSALVDAADFALTSSLSWTAHKGKNGTWYARGYRRLPDGRKQWVYMHRLITDAGVGQLVDHKNHDGTDNRRHNLRLCNGSQNNMNRRTIVTTSQYRGVSLAANGKWLAQIMKDRHQNYIGQFHTEGDAARAYNAAAVKLFGSFATLNELPKGDIEIPAIEFGLVGGSISESSALATITSRMSEQTPCGGGK